MHRSCLSFVSMCLLTGLAGLAATGCASRMTTQGLATEDVARATRDAIHAVTERKAVLDPGQAEQFEWQRFLSTERMEVVLREEDKHQVTVEVHRESMFIVSIWGWARAERSERLILSLAADELWAVNENAIADSSFGLQPVPLQRRPEGPVVEVTDGKELPVPEAMKAVDTDVVLAGLDPARKWEKTDDGGVLRLAWVKGPGRVDMTVTATRTDDGYRLSTDGSATYDRKAWVLRRLVRWLSYRAEGSQPVR